MTLALDEPIDAAKTNLLLMEMTDDRGLHYQWLIPGHKIRPAVGEDFDPHWSYSFRAGSSGFHRSGVGLCFPNED